MLFATPEPITLLDFFDGHFKPDDRDSEIHYFRVCLQESGKMPCTCAITEDCFNSLSDSKKGKRFNPVGEVTQRGKFRIVKLVKVDD